MKVRRASFGLQPPWRRSASGVVCATILAVSSAPLTHGQAGQPAIRSTAAGVLIDATVVDQKGQPILDLRADEFELSEEGARQQILSVSLFHGGISRPVGSVPPVVWGAAAPASGSGRPGLDTEPSGAASPVPSAPSVTAILFDRLSPEARPLAHKAGTAYISTLGPHDYAGVFLADVKLLTAGSFSNDPGQVRHALDRVAGTAPVALTAEAGASTAISRGLPVDTTQPVTAGAEATAGWVNAAEREKALNVPGSEGMFRRMEIRMQEGHQQFLTEYGGQVSLAALRTVVSALGLMPGRKSVFYLTENLPITDRLKARFEALIGEANRHNVTVYAVDAAGLRVHSKEAEVGRGVSVAGSQGLGDARRDDGPWTRDLEQQDQLLTSRPTAVLGRLTKDTGGFLLENTNNLTGGVARMRQERTTYYLIAYQPSKSVNDGKFRKVTVKVKRPKVTVRARPGYQAAGS